MTAIAYRDGIMAADTAAWNDRIISGHVNKIVRLPCGSLFAAQGDREYIEAYLRWRRDGGERPAAVDKLELFFGLLVRPDGIAFWVGGSTYEPYPVDHPYAALGACQEYLYGALAAGATAAEAITLAIENHDSAGGKVQIEGLEHSTAPS